MTVLDRRYRRRSALQAFACPRYFHGTYGPGAEQRLVGLERVERAGRDSNPSRRGTAFHLVVHRYIQLLLEHQCSDDLDLAQQAFREAIAASSLPLPLIAEVDDIWWRFVPTFQLDVDSVYAAEERPDDEYDWQPDLVRVYGDVLDITDFKTHFAILSETAAETAFQVRFYSARARRIWPGFGTYRFTLWFVRWGAIIHIEVSQGDIDRHEEQLQLLEAGIATALQTNHWPAVPGETCQYCDLQCPIADNANLTPVRIQTRAEAEEAFGEYLALTAALKRRREALEDWTGFEGPVQLRGREFGPRPTSRAEFPIAQVLAVLRAHDLAPTFTVSRTALKPYLSQQRYRHLAPELEEIAIRKPSTEYRVRSIGDVAPEGFEGETEA